MNPIWYTITGVIDPNIAQQLIMWVNQQVIGAPAATLQNFKLIVLISSGGGDIDSAIRIYNYLKALPIVVETIGLSQVDSAANIIFLAGQRRSAVKRCRFFLHEGTFTIGNPTAPLGVHEETLSILKSLSMRHVDILTTELGKNPEEVRVLLNEGKILDIDAAISLGLVHQSIDKLPVG